MKRTIAALALALAATVLPAVPAQAAVYECGSDAVCVSVYHRNDSGFDPAIMVRCSHSTANYVIPEGWWDPCVDVTKVYTPAGQELWGFTGSRWYKFRDRTGWSDSGNLSYRYLTVARD